MIFKLIRFCFCSEIVEAANQLTAENLDEHKDKTEELCQLLQGYTQSCHGLAMEYVEKKALRESGRVLRGCEDFMKNRMPPSGIRVVKKRGLMHTVFNNLAQHANLMADMPRSIDYLKMALEVADDKETDKRLLPLAETFLNLANGTSYLNRYHEALEYAEKAMKFADKKCNKLRAEIIAFQRKPEFE